MPEKTIGVPTVGGLKSTAEDALLGAAAGAIFAFSQQIFGKGWIGAIVGILLAGTVIKGDRGQDVVTILGALGAISLFGGSIAVPGTASGNGGGTTII